MRKLILPLSALLLLARAPDAAAGQEERELGWKNATELGFVVTAGNSDTINFNVRNLFNYDWQRADLDWEIGVLRASSSDDRFAVGSPEDFEIVEPDSEPDNQRVYTHLRYLRRLDERFFWYARFFAERDEPADIDYRMTPSAGAGNDWVRRDDFTFRTGYGVSYTAESLSLEGSSDFAGYQLFYDLDMEASDTTRIESNLTFDGSVRRAANYRFDWLNGVGVSITEKIALRTSVRLVYRNQPASERIDLEDAAGLPIGKVTVAKDKVDSAFTTSLVINF